MENAIATLAETGTVFKDTPSVLMGDLSHPHRSERQSQMLPG
jgi:hypothetical protein